MKRLHPKNHTGQRTAQDLRVGKFGPALKVLLVIQANANAVGNPPTAPGALVGRTLADGLDQQLLNLASEAVALHARGAGINDVANARYGERSFGHVGGQHDSPPSMTVKNAVLLCLAQPRKQGQYLGGSKQGLVAQVFAKMIGGFTDFTLAGQEHQNVAAVVHVAPEFVHTVSNGVIQVIFTRLFKRAVTLFDREHAAGHHDDWGGHLAPTIAHFVWLPAPQGGCALLGAPRCGGCLHGEVIGKSLCIYRG